jgi:hypothetical protein
MMHFARHRQSFVRGVIAAVMLACPLIARAQPAPLMDACKKAGGPVLTG